MGRNYPYKRAIIVGASSGIGEAMALELTASGVQVALVARRVEELERIQKKSPDTLKVYPHDVRTFDEVPPVLTIASTAPLFR